MSCLIIAPDKFQLKPATYKSLNFKTKCFKYAHWTN